jgi:4-hydroxybenzoate polyprenyltransferase
MALLAMYAVTGVAAAGGNLNSPARVTPVLIVVAGFLTYSVCLNDVADLEVDRVNLPGRSDRPLVIGTAQIRQLVAIAVVGAVVSLAAAAWIGWPALLVCAGGLAVSTAYSLRPFRLASRGAVASLVLPACYVALPYTTGSLSASASFGVSDLVMLVALYVGFVGRILLKDFRDVRGDALFGKRTFLVRHGRKATCRFSAAGWVAGTSLTLFAMSLHGQLAVGLIAAMVFAVGGVLGLLCALAIDRGPRRDELIVSTIAIVGRGQLLVVLVALSLAERSALLVSGLIGALTVVIAGQAHQVLRRGPVMRHAVPAAWAGVRGQADPARPTASTGRVGSPGRASATS